MRLADLFRGARRHPKLVLASQVLDRLLGIRQRLAVVTTLILDLSCAPTLERAGKYDGRPIARRDRFAVRLIDCVEVVTVDLDRMPAKRSGPRRVPSKV